MVPSGSRQAMAAASRARFWFESFLPELSGKLFVLETRQQFDVARRRGGLVAF